MDRRILIGKVATAHGIKGDVKVLCFADDADLLFQDAGVYTDKTTQKRVVLTFKAEQKHNQFIANVHGLTDRNSAEKLRGLEFYIDRDELPELDENTMYYSEMAGMDVVSADGKAMGKVLRVQNFGAGELIEIQGKKEAYYLPFSAPHLVSMDKEKRVIVMNEPEVI